VRHDFFLRPRRDQTDIERELSSAGIYRTGYGEYPKIQILTVEQLFAGQRPEKPWIDPTVFRKAKREMKGT
jgi:site-specific DNA-methyltransferase (adenine-specific)